MKIIRGEILRPSSPRQVINNANNKYSNTMGDLEQTKLARKDGRYERGVPSSL